MVKMNGKMEEIAISSNNEIFFKSIFSCCESFSSTSKKNNKQRYNLIVDHLPLNILLGREDISEHISNLKEHEIIEISCAKSRDV